MRNAGQAEPKMSRVKVFYIIISIGALFSKVSSAEDKKPGSIAGASTARMIRRWTMGMMTRMWDMFWWPARSSHPCQDHDLFSQTPLHHQL